MCDIEQRSFLLQDSKHGGHRQDLPGHGFAQFVNMQHDEFRTHDCRIAFACCLLNVLSQVTVQFIATSHDHFPDMIIRVGQRNGIVQW